MQNLKLSLEDLVKILKNAIPEEFIGLKYFNSKEDAETALNI
jgi:hypothetical protein